MALSLQGQEAIAGFKQAANWSFAASLALHMGQVAFGFDPLVLLGGNLAILVVLFRRARRAHELTDGGFDAGVAAETIVAFGVLALILGLVVALARAFVVQRGEFTFTVDTVRQLGAPFALGLATAAIAPTVAVLLRNQTARHEREDGTAEELQLVSHAARELAAELDAAKAAAVSLTRVLGAAEGATARLGPVLVGNLTSVADATGRIGPTLDAGVANFTGLLEAGAQRFTGEVDQAGRRFTTELDGARAQVGSLGDAARAGASELQQLGADLGRVRGGAGEAAELLEALGELTASVERFVGARAVAP